MKKRILTAGTALALCLAMGAAALPASAASANQSSADSLGTAFSYTYHNDPTFTVTIPSAIDMDTNGSQVAIAAENVANLDGRKISVTIAGTQYFRNQMVMEGVDDKGMKKTLRYQIETAAGELIETTGSDTATGKELASFTENGTASYTVKPVLHPTTAKGVTYTGSMTYGISVVDAN
ncbi:MAG: hypothetical protein ACLSAP_10260 [Oscillospiraceae bacterium]